MKIYNRLVRDKIPQIIESTGKAFETCVDTRIEFNEFIKKKLLEEIKSVFGYWNRH